MKRFLSMMILLVMLLSVAAPAMAVKEEFCATYGHKWERIGKSAPTCTENGSVLKKCKICGEVEKTTTKKLGHDYKVQKVTVQATCTTKGEEKLKCSRCGATKTRKTDYAAHAYGEWQITVAATESSKGVRSRVCSVCGKEQTEEYYPDGTFYRGGGDKEAVKEVQTQLKDCGYLNDIVDGIFGKNTEQAVKDFQTAAGLNPDGIVWPETMKLLEKEWLVKTGAYVANCIRIEDENGVVEFRYCEEHKPMIEEVETLFAAEDADQKKVEILGQVREMYQAEVTELYAEWLAASADEEKPNVLGAQTMFSGYLNAQEQVWNKQYGENSEETLTKVNEMLHDKWVELCGFVAPAAAE